MAAIEMLTSSPVQRCNNRKVHSNAHLCSNLGDELQSSAFFYMLLQLQLTSLEVFLQMCYLERERMRGGRIVRGGVGGG